MTVYVAFRRGNWLFHFLTLILDPLSKYLWIKSILLKIGYWSWIRCGLHFHIPCTYPSCSHTQCKGQKPFHTVTILTDAENDSVVRVIDMNFNDTNNKDKEEAWLFVALPGMPDERASSFWNSLPVLRYNTEGWLYNFLPWPFGRNVGVQGDNNYSMVDSVFCSELVTVFLQDNGYHKLELVPCQTSPTQLLIRLFQINPKLKQYRLVGNRLESVTV